MRKSLLFIMSIVIIILLYASLFIVQEGQRGIILRFRKILLKIDNKPLIYKPGLHIKIPFIETVKNIDARIQNIENHSDRFSTIEKKDLIVNSYIKWRVNNFGHYYLATGGDNISQVEMLLKRKFSDYLRLELSRIDMKRVLIDSHKRLINNIREALNNEISGYNEEPHIITANNITSSDILRTKCKSNDSHSLANPNSMVGLGIEIIDVRIKQINLPTEVSDTIYQRMRAECKEIARRYRSQGKEEAEKLRAKADYKVARILAKAKHQVLITRGETDAETTKLYADACVKDPVFHIFYTFIRSLRAYENSFNSNDVILLSQKNNFFRFMKSP
ncbi:Modulator of FtsH protease HflC [Candidatus Gullanella endobia]|uniref:Protein HflC n=1 Tax=Candidatus Gullanella endobia TaxID=1070130 RepID=A0A143WQX9_9ENTR|nr:protease modulator HflC [Candidatus Gullanella endobia]CUX96132.1 Modulator of FtsH protease HflC [Candidatus Gullanella endobia]